MIKEKGSCVSQISLVSCTRASASVFSPSSIYSLKSERRGCLCQQDLIIIAKIGIVVQSNICEKGYLFTARESTQLGCSMPGIVTGTAQI